MPDKQTMMHPMIKAFVEFGEKDAEDTLFLRFGLL